MTRRELSEGSSKSYEQILEMSLKRVKALLHIQKSYVESNMSTLTSKLEILNGLDLKLDESAKASDIELLIDHRLSDVVDLPTVLPEQKYCISAIFSPKRFVLRNVILKPTLLFHLIATTDVLVTCTVLDVQQGSRAHQHRAA